MFAAGFPLFGTPSEFSDIFTPVGTITDRMEKVYNNLGPQWATFVLAMITLALGPFP